jgi:hypothetical protein
MALLGIAISLVSELLSGRHPIRPGGRAITVARDCHFIYT